MPYYIDGADGLDSNTGTSWAQAWKTLDKLNNLHFALDYVYIKQGTYYLTMDITMYSLRGRGGNGSIVGVGAVVIKNPLNKTLTARADLYDYNREGGTYFWNICFSLWLTAVPLLTFYSGDSYQCRCTWMFVNCSFFGKLFRDVIEIPNVILTNCTVKSGDTIPANTGLDAEHNPFYVANSAVTIAQIACSISGVVTAGNIVISANVDYAGLIGCYFQNIKNYCPVDTFLPWPDAYAMQIPVNSSGHSVMLALTTGWQDDLSYPDGRMQIDENQIYIKEGGSGRVITPVYESFQQCILLGVGIRALEYGSVGAGNNVVIDSTPLTVERTIEIRVSDTTFLPTDTLPVWQEYVRGSAISFVGVFFQFRLTFITTGA